MAPALIPRQIPPTRPASLPRKGRAIKREAISAPRVARGLTEVAAHDAVPSRVVLLVELLLDVSSNVLLDVVLLESLRGGALGGATLSATPHAAGGRQSAADCPRIPHKHIARATSRPSRASPRQGDRSRALEMSKGLSPNFGARAQFRDTPAHTRRGGLARGDKLGSKHIRSAARVMRGRGDRQRGESMSPAARACRGKRGGDRAGTWVAQSMASCCMSSDMSAFLITALRSVMVAVARGLGSLRLCRHHD